MAFRRRRRKPVVKWLYNPGTAINQSGIVIPNADVLDNPASIELSFATTVGVPTTISAPMVVDQPSSEAFSGGALSVFQENTLTLSNDLGYRLRRIVGDLFIGAVAENGQVQGDLCVPGVLVELGFIIRRVDSDGQPAADGQDQDVGAIQNNSDPWIWRRNYVLGVEGAFIAPTDRPAAILANFPTNNADYGQSRTQIDQKTARRVGPEERLFFDLTVWNLPFATATVWNKVPIIYCMFDYRVLASLSLTAGNRRNASR